MPKEIEHVEPEPREPGYKIPINLRLRATWALVQDTFMHPLTESRIVIDVENNKIRVQRVRKPQGD